MMRRLKIQADIAYGIAKLCESRVLAICEIRTLWINGVIVSCNSTE